MVEEITLDDLIATERFDQPPAPSVRALSDVLLVDDAGGGLWARPRGNAPEEEPHEPVIGTADGEALNTVEGTAEQEAPAGPSGPELVEETMVLFGQDKDDVYLNLVRAYLQ